MSKTSLSIQMLNYLYGKTKVSKTEIARFLETNERNIVEYRKELLNAGYEITYTGGRYGGYSLVRDSTFVPTHLSENEKTSLLEASEYLSNNKEFMHADELSVAVGKVLAHTKSNADFDMINIDRFPLKMSKEELKSRYESLDMAISKKLKVYIKYRSIKNTVKESLFHPYNLYSYNDSWYVIGFYENELNKQISQSAYYLKLNRIEDIRVTNNKYYPIETFNINKYLDSQGMSKNGELYHLKLLLSSPQSFLVQERIFGENQTITELDLNHSILECDMRNKDNVISFINYFGDKVKVLGPEEIKEDVILTKRKMLVNEGIYKKTIIFDFNGTILDDLDLCINILNDMLTSHGFSPVSKKRYLEIFTFPIEDYYKEAGFDFSKVKFKDLSEEFIKKYQKPSLSCKLHEGLVDILKKLSSEYYNIVLLTASKTTNVIEQLKSFGIEKYFNEILGISDIYAKSKVEVGKRYMEMNNIDPKNTIMIGDTLHDATVAHELGIDVLLYDKGHQSKERLLQSGHTVIDNLSEIFEFI